MPEKKGNGEKRDPKTGRLLPGHKPPKSPGRPKRLPGEKPVKQTAHRKALDIVEGMLGKAHKAIDGALTANDDGPADPRVAMWLIDRLIPKDDSSLPKDMEVQLNTMEGVVEAAQTTVEWVATRQLTIEKGERMLRLLLTYAQMRAFDHIDELRSLITQFEQQSAGAVTKLNPALVPQWGRLTEKSGVANDTPAE